MNAATLINDYEHLRAGVLASRSAAGTHRRSMHWLDQGLHAWLVGRSGAPPQPAPTPSGLVASAYTIPLMQHHDMVQLLASMTLQSITEDTHVCLQ
jgi:hypothetical protein